MSPRPIGTIVTAMITPFDDRGEVDLREAARVASWLVDRGNEALVVAGSTGEGQTLTREERRALARAVKESVGDRAAVVANAGTNDTRESVRNLEDAERDGVDAVLAVVPYYNKPPQSGMIAHFGHLAQSSSLPVLIYNIPGRTAANMLPETQLELASRHANIAGVKESSGDMLQIGTVLAARPPSFAVYAGDDHAFLPALAMGADGVVGVASHLCSPQYVAMCNAYRSGRVSDAAAIHCSLLPLIRALFAATNPIPVKWAMRQLGFKTGECRLPLDGMPQAAAQMLSPLLRDYADAAKVASRT